MRSLHILPFYSLAFLQINASCFHPNGTQTTDLYHAPCGKNPSDPLSTICCAIERPNPAGGLGSDGFTKDVCLDNGLCMNEWRAGADGKEVHRSYWREECTETNWKAGKCLDVCVGEVNGGNALMTPCNDDPRSETWCCGESKACCGTLKGIQQLPLRFNHAVINSSSTALPSSSATATSTSIPAKQSESSSLGGGAIAGIVIGAIAGIAVLLAVAFVVLKRRRRRSGTLLESDPVLQPSYHDAKTYYAHEAEGTTPPVEAPAGQSYAYELGTDAR